MNLQISKQYNIFQYLKEKFLEKMYLLDFDYNLLEE